MFDLHFRMIYIKKFILYKDFWVYEKKDVAKTPQVATFLSFALSFLDLLHFCHRLKED